MHDDTITHKDLANILGVSETTVKSYRRKFPGCIPVANQGKPIRFEPKAKEVCLRIRDLFSTGMSVEEVRERLASEFPWCKNNKVQKNEEEKPEKIAPGHDLSNNFATALSNMAKSMISLHQQQASILSTMQGIEAMLKNMGLGGFSGPEAESLRKEQIRKEAQSRDTLREINKLSSSMNDLVQFVQLTLNENKKINASLANERSAIFSGVEKIIAASGLGAQAEVIPGKVVQLQTQQETIPQPVPSNQPSSEIPRHLLPLPLVFRREDGSYMSAGGRTPGKISLNDLKAMLALEFIPPENFVMRWEKPADVWWVVLEQPGIPAPEEAVIIRLQVTEITSARGLSVLEIKQYIKNNEQKHPAEFYDFISSIGERRD